MLLAFVSVGLVSKEFKRFTGNAWASLAESRTDMAFLTFGLGVGLVAGTAFAALLL